MQLNSRRGRSSTRGSGLQLNHDGLKSLRSQVRKMEDLEQEVLRSGDALGLAGTQLACRIGGISPSAAASVVESPDQIARARQRPALSTEGVPSGSQSSGPSTGWFRDSAGRLHERADESATTTHPAAVDQDGRRASGNRNTDIGPGAALKTRTAAVRSLGAAAESRASKRRAAAEGQQPGADEANVRPSESRAAAVRSLGAAAAKRRATFEKLQLPGADKANEQVERPTKMSALKGKGRGGWFRGGEKKGGGVSGRRSSSGESAVVEGVGEGPGYAELVGELEKLKQKLTLVDSKTDAGAARTGAGAHQGEQQQQPWFTGNAPQQQPEQQQQQQQPWFTGNAPQQQPEQQQQQPWFNGNAPQQQPEQEQQQQQQQQQPQPWFNGNAPQQQPEQEQQQQQQQQQQQPWFNGNAPQQQPEQQQQKQQQPWFNGNAPQQQPKQHQQQQQQQQQQPWFNGNAPQQQPEQEQEQQQQQQQPWFNGNAPQQQPEQEQQQQQQQQQPSFNGNAPQQQPEQHQQQQQQQQPWFNGNAPQQQPKQQQQQQQQQQPWFTGNAPQQQEQQQPSLSIETSPQQQQQQQKQQQQSPQQQQTLCLDHTASQQQRSRSPPAPQTSTIPAPQTSAIPAAPLTSSANPLQSPQSGITRLTSAAAPGDMILHVLCNDGFAAGMAALLGPAGHPACELVLIEALGSLRLLAPLMYSHGKGEIVKAVARKAVSTQNSMQPTVNSPSAGMNLGCDWGSPTADDMFDMMDANSDGVISREEFKAVAAVSSPNTSHPAVGHKPTAAHSNTPKERLQNAERTPPGRRDPFKGSKSRIDELLALSWNLIASKVQERRDAQATIRNVLHEAHDVSKRKEWEHMVGAASDRLPHDANNTQQLEMAPPTAKARQLLKCQDENERLQQQLSACQQELKVTGTERDILKQQQPLEELLAASVATEACSTENELLQKECSEHLYNLKRCQAELDKCKKELLATTDERDELSFENYQLQEQCCTQLQQLACVSQGAAAQKIAVDQDLAASQKELQEYKEQMQAESACSKQDELEELGRCRQELKESKQAMLVSEENFVHFKRQLADCTRQLEQSDAERQQLEECCASQAGELELCMGDLQMLQVDHEQMQQQALEQLEELGKLHQLLESNEMQFEEAEFQSNQLEAQCAAQLGQLEAAHQVLQKLLPDQHDVKSLLAGTAAAKGRKQSGGWFRGSAASLLPLEAADIGTSGDKVEHRDAQWFRGSPKAVQQPQPQPKTNGWFRGSPQEVDGTKVDGEDVAPDTNSGAVPSGEFWGRTWSLIACQMERYMLQLQCAGHLQVIEAAQTELHSFQQEMDQLPERLLAAETERDVLWEQCGSQLENLQLGDELVRERNMLRQAADEAIEGLKTCEEQLSTCKLELDVSKQEHELQQQLLQQKTDELHDCQQEIEASQTSQGHFQEAYQRDLNLCHQALQASEQDRQWLQQELTAQQHAVPELQRELEARVNECEHLQKQCLAVAQELEIANEALLQLAGGKHALEDSVIELKDAQHKHQQLELQLAKQQYDLEKAWKELGACQVEREHLKELCEAYQQEENCHKLCQNALGEALQTPEPAKSAASAARNQKWSPGARSAVTAALWRVAEEKPRLLAQIPGMSHQMQIDTSNQQPEQRMVAEPQECVNDSRPWFRGPYEGREHAEPQEPAKDSSYKPWFRGQPTMHSPYN